MPSDPHSFQAVGWIVVALAGLLVIARNTVGFWREITRPTGQDAIAHASAQFQPRGDYVTRSELEEAPGNHSGVARPPSRTSRPGGPPGRSKTTSGSGESMNGSTVFRRDHRQLSNLGVLVRPNLDRHPV